MDATEYGYQGWRTATADQWNSLLLTVKTRDGNQAKALAEAGFAAGSVDNLIIYTGETVGREDRSLQWTWVPGSEPYAPLADATAVGLCLLDTAAPASSIPAGYSGVRCRQAGFLPLSGLLNFFAFGRYPFKGGEGSTFDYSYDPATLTTANPDYFAGKISGKLRGTAEPLPADIVRQPGWMQTSAKDALAQYRWPVMDRRNPTMTCSKVALDSKHALDLRAENAAGMPTMCGQDFLDWLGTWLPAAPKV